MSYKVLLSGAAIIVVSGLLYGTYIWRQQQVDNLNAQVSRLNTELAASKDEQTTAVNSSYTSKKGVAITVYTPRANSQLVSPGIVLGEVPGSWSFEGSFPVKLMDSKGNVVAQAAAQLQKDWMTDKPVPFIAKLTFANPPGGSATLLLQKDNPSGLEANDDSLSILLRL